MAWRDEMAKRRRSGRTTRMIEEAIRLARVERRAVYVLTHNSTEALRLRGEIARRLRPDERDSMLGIKVEPFRPMESFSVNTMSVRGAHENCAFLVDHHAIEHRFERLLIELHRYDADDTQEGGAQPSS